MTPDIRRLYLFHLFNSIAVAVVANYLFLDKLFLRMDLNMSQFGLIKGLSWWVPMVINVLLAPLIAARRIDQKIVAIGHGVRVVLPFGLLALPLVTENTAALTAGFAVILMASQLFPVVANNCTQVLMKAHIPKQTMGLHTSRITALWFLPYALVTIPMAWYVERHSHGTDARFLGALLTVACVTTIFQIPASILAWRISPAEGNGHGRAHFTWVGLFEPLRDKRFRSLLSVVAAVGTVSSMVGSFVVPYLIAGLGWPLQRIGILVAVVSAAGAVALPLWGRLTDRIGGKNMLRLAVAGIALGVFMLSQRSSVAVIVFAVLAWQCETGVFGSALVMGRQYLVMSMSRPEQSNLYMAWVGPMLGTGILLGSIAGGLLLDWLAVRVRPELVAEHYRIYFTYCAMGFLLCVGLTATVRDGHRVVTATAGLQQGYRWMRTVLWRGRL